MATAGAPCGDGHCEEDVHNVDAGERAGHGSGGRLRRGQPRTSTTAVAAAANLKPTAAGSGGEVWSAAAGTGAAKKASVVDAAANLKLATASAGGEDGRSALRDVALAGADTGGDGRTSGRAVLCACCKEAY